VAYIVITLVTIIIGTGGSTWYYKDAYEKEALTNLQYMRLSEALQAENKRIQEANETRIQVLNEQHKRYSDDLRADIRGMRKQTSSSIMPKTKDPRSTEITFSKEQLDTAIQGFRGEIQALIARGAECQLDLNTAKEWASGIEQ
jgi:hypothetical protein